MPQHQAGVVMAECDVFIAYKREERPRVEQLAQKLKAIGLSVWFDTSLASGSPRSRHAAAVVDWRVRHRFFGDLVL